jgi:hypothetical protein
VASTNTALLLLLKLQDAQQPPPLALCRLPRRLARRAAPRLLLAAALREFREAPSALNFGFTDRQ